MIVRRYSFWISSFSGTMFTLLVSGPCLAVVLDQVVGVLYLINVSFVAKRFQVYPLGYDRHPRTSNSI